MPWPRDLLRKDRDKAVSLGLLFLSLGLLFLILDWVGGGFLILNVGIG